MDLCTLEAIRKAQSVLAGVAEHTPVFTSETLSRLTGATVYLKAENLQRTGSFKVRGAFNKVMNLSAAQKAAGVIAASAGNHAQGVAFAASRAGVPATIVMAETASMAKVAATRGYGAQVVLSGRTYDEAYEKARALQAEHGYTFVHAYNDLDIIAGQGTVGLEIARDVPEADVVVVPIGGGGLISGVATAVKALMPGVRVVGVQAKGAPAAYLSHQYGRIQGQDVSRTLADGLAVKAPGDLTFAHIEKLVDEIVLVDEDAIAHAMYLLLERAKLVVEGAGAASVAALVSGATKWPGRRVVALLSGGNIDTGLLARIVDRGMAQAGRYFRLFTRLADEPGALRALLDVVAAQKGNIVAVNHDRLRGDVAPGEAEVSLIIETRDTSHRHALGEALTAAGYSWREV